MPGADKREVMKKQSILSRAKRFLRGKSCFCSKEQVFFTNRPELHHYRDGVHFSSWESMACLLVREEGCNLLGPTSKSIPNKSKYE